MIKYREFRGRVKKNRITVVVDHIHGYSFMMYIYNTGPLNYFMLGDIVSKAIVKRGIPLRDTMFKVV